MTGPTGHGSTWPQIASWYDVLVDRGSGPHETAIGCLLHLLPDVRGSTVVDVACGTGIAARAVARAGAAHVMGVDLAEPMLELARRRTESTLPITYVPGDAQRLGALADASIDGAVCQLGLMDIADLPATLRSVRRVLRPHGWFAFVDSHPCYLSPHAETLTVEHRLGRLLTEYFAEGFWRSTNPDGVRGKVGGYHRTLATYLNALVGAGFVLEQAHEPVANARLAEEQPVYRQVPIFFAARARSTAAAG